MTLRHSLLATLAYFDLFDYPLTLSELCRLRYRLPGEERVGDAGMRACLEALAGPEAGERDGYYFLPGRASIVATRQRRYRLAEKKFRRAKRAARLMSLLPSVRLVAVCNSLAISNADTESDIDLFLVCRPGTLWTTRCCIVGMLKLLGLRPSGSRSADMLCLSFFVSEDHLDLSSLSLPGGDVYLKYWIATLVPLYDAGGVAERLFHANAAWIKSGPVLKRPRYCGRRTVGWRVGFFPNFFARVCRIFENPLRRLQIAIMPKGLAEAANRDSRVVLNERVLKFHALDRRAEFEKKFKERLDRISEKNYAESPCPAS